METSHIMTRTLPTKKLIENKINNDLDHSKIPGIGFSKVYRSFN